MTNGSGDHGGSAEKSEAKKDEPRRAPRAASGPKETPPLRPKSE